MGTIYFSINNNNKRDNDIPSHISHRGELLYAVCSFYTMLIASESENWTKDPSANIGYGDIDLPRSCGPWVEYRVCDACEHRHIVFRDVRPLTVR
jgi:hypothetical protein